MKKREKERELWRKNKMLTSDIEYRPNPHEPFSDAWWKEWTIVGYKWVVKTMHC